jgi:hypothetical protein
VITSGESTAELVAFDPLPTASACAGSARALIGTTALNNAPTERRIMSCLHDRGALIPARTGI